MPDDQTFTHAPTHPEEIRATYEVRIGKSVSLQGTARITPAGIVTLGVASSAILLCIAAIVRAKCSRRS